jgi:hypothetical protein
MGITTTGQRRNVAGGCDVGVKGGRVVFLYRGGPVALVSVLELCWAAVGVGIACGAFGLKAESLFFAGPKKSNPKKWPEGS